MSLELEDDDVSLAKLNLEEYGSSEHGHELLYDPSKDEYHVLQDDPSEEKEYLIYPDEESTVPLEWSQEDQERYTNAFMEKFLHYSMQAFESEAPEIADKEALYQNQSNRYANLALAQYNDDNDIKYELVKATESCYIMDADGTYAHVNFIAKATESDSEEQLFFAEVRLRKPSMTTCLCLLDQGVDQTGGYACNTDKQTLYQTKDEKFCYACGDSIKHPCSETDIYEAGHYTLMDFYRYD